MANIDISYIMNKEVLINRIKAAGQDLIDNAEELASNINYTTDITIWIRGFLNSEIPEIEIQQTFVGSNSLKVRSND